MRTKITRALVAFLLLGPSSRVGANDHRLLVLDVLKETGSPTSEVVVFKVESGKIAAKTQVGGRPEIGLSLKRDMIAVLTSNLLGGVAQPNARLQTISTSDLAELEKGLIPVVPRGGFQHYPPVPTIAFSPNGSEIVIQCMRSYLNDAKPVRYPVHNVSLNFLKRELDQDGKFLLSRPEITVKCCQVAEFLRISKWPKLDVWNFSLGAVEVIDIGGTVHSRVPFDYEDDPLLTRLDPSYLENPNLGELSLHLGSNGRVIGGGRYAYYIPEPLRNSKAKPGFVKKIALDADPPRVVLEGDQRQENLWVAAACASETGGAVLVAIKKDGDAQEPSGKIRIYSAVTLKLVNEIQLSISNCDGLEASLDGKYAYALDRKGAKLAVIDIASGREVKCLNNVGKFPVVVLALP